MQSAQLTDKKDRASSLPNGYYEVTTTYILQIKLLGLF